MKNANFIAIDFETATPQRAACQIGIVVVKEGGVTEKISRLIQPPKNKYSKNCINVHGITPEMTANSPTFDVVWEEIKEHFEGNFIVAHKSSFDLNVLDKALDTYGLANPIFMGTACTYQLSGMSLEKACNTYNIPLCNHHDGLCDAEACALLFLKYLNGEFANDIELEELEEDNTPNCSSISTSHTEHHFNTFKHSLFLESCTTNDLLASFTDSIISSLEPSLFFLDKKFIITGGTVFNRDRAYEIIKKLGGKKSSSVNKSLDYIILGEEPGPKKIEQLNELKEEGYSINILSDLEFIEFLESSLKSILNEE